MAQEQKLSSKLEEPKPGWKTTEFWLSTAAAAISLVYASGSLLEAPDWLTTTIGIVAGVLTTLGYTINRAVVKAADSKTRTAVRDALIKSAASAALLKGESYDRKD